LYRLHPFSLHLLFHYIPRSVLFHATATTELYTLSLHDALPICKTPPVLKAYFRHPVRLRHPESLLAPSSQHPLKSPPSCERSWRDRQSTRLNSRHVAISYAVFCLKKKNRSTYNHKTLSTYTKRA